MAQDFVGGDLRVRDNPRRVAGAEQCQQECADTPGCQVRTFLSALSNTYEVTSPQNWSWERRRGGGGRRNSLRRSRCWLKGSSFRKQGHRDRVSGPRLCVDITITNPNPRPNAHPTCVTTGGGRAGANCVFPFTYKVESSVLLLQFK